MREILPFPKFHYIFLHKNILCTIVKTMDKITYFKIILYLIFYQVFLYTFQKYNILVSVPISSNVLGIRRFCSPNKGLRKQDQGCKNVVVVRRGSERSDRPSRTETLEAGLSRRKRIPFVMRRFLLSIISYLSWILINFDSRKYRFSKTF